MATESQNLPFSCLPCLYFLLSAIVALHLSRVLYKFAPFYAKQTQFPKRQNEHSSLSRNKLRKKGPIRLPQKQSQTNPIQTRNAAQIPMGELLGIFKPGTNQTQFQKQKNAAEFVQRIFARENRQETICKGKTEWLKGRFCIIRGRALT